MYLHIGNEHVIALRDIVAVVDAETLLQSEEGKNLLRQAKRQRQFVDSTEEHINAYVITDHYIYASAISAYTLKRRSTNPQYLEEIG